MSKFNTIVQNWSSDINKITKDSAPARKSFMIAVLIHDTDQNESNVVAKCVDAWLGLLVQELDDTVGWYYVVVF